MGVGRPEKKTEIKLNNTNKELFQEVKEKLELVKALKHFKKAFLEIKEDIDVSYSLKKYEGFILRIGYLNCVNMFYLNLTDTVEQRVLFATDGTDIYEMLEDFKKFVYLKLQNERQYGGN